MQKISQDKAKGILLIPVWPTQTWFPLVLQLLYSQPWIFKPSANLLCHAHFREPHPLHKSLHLMVCPLSGTPSRSKTFLQTLPPSSWPPGGKELKTSTKAMWKIDHSSPQISEALQFLMYLYNQGLSYSTINTARSALSSILNISGSYHFGSHPLVTRFLKGIYETRKPQPKYKTIWDVATVLTYLKTLWPLEQLSLKDLTIKLVILLLLVTGQRGQSIHLLNLDGMSMSSQSCSFELLDHIKTSKPNKRDSSIDIESYQPDNTLCPLLTLKEYLKKTQPLRDTERKLFISIIQPHKGVSRDTISRWTKSGLKSAGIDTSQFTAHSTRAASSSKAKERDVPLDVILATAGWCLATTFHKFYHKPIVQQPTLAETVLQL